MCPHTQIVAINASTKDIQKRSQKVKILEVGIGSQDPRRRNQMGGGRLVPAVGNARVWFDDLPVELIYSYDDLKKAFLENYLQQKKCIKDPIEIHYIKQRDGESTKDFVKRYKLESRDVKGAPECMRISEFVHGITNPELIKRLHDKIPKTVDEMIRVTTSFIGGKWQPRITNERCRFHHRNNKKVTISKISRKGAFGIIRGRKGNKISLRSSRKSQKKILL
nr:reverse transcriptase domain-containing protein [Tanacetum cinerariifolium]